MANAIILNDLINYLGLSINKFELRIGAGSGSVRKAIKEEFDISENLIEKIVRNIPNVSRAWLQSGQGEMILSADEQPTKPTGQSISERKAFEGRKQKGILFVPVTAQAGYSRMMGEDFAVFESHLERTVIPGLPYDGDDFRAFQVEGESMEYVNQFGQVDGLQSGMWVLTQRVPKEDWAENLSLYRIHVIVLSRQIVIKRILQDNDHEIVLHSDNEALYPQERISLADVREIWYVVRKLDWNMPPPRKIAINV